MKPVRNSDESKVNQLVVKLDDLFIDGIHQILNQALPEPAFTTFPQHKREHILKRLLVQPTWLR